MPPSKLLTLYEIVSWLMKPFKADTFYKVGKLLERLATIDPSAQTLGKGFFDYPEPIPLPDRRPLDYADRDSLKVIMDSVGKECSGINLDRASKYAQHIIAQLEEVESLTNERVAWLFKELDKHVRWDMEKEFFMYIPADRAKYYNMEKPFGQQVYDSFPSARFDLTEAGNCIAFGSYTAAGLHLMRGAEVALWELGRDRQIPLVNKIEFEEWGKIIRELEDAVKGIQQWPNSPSKEEAHRFYNSALIEIRAFNDGIRRHLAHVRKDQTPLLDEEAVALFGHVSRFMHGLAERIGEDKHTSLIW